MSRNMGLIFWGIVIKDIITCVYLFLNDKYNPNGIGNLFYSRNIFLLVSLTILGYHIYEAKRDMENTPFKALYAGMFLFLLLIISGATQSFMSYSGNIEITFLSLTARTNAWVLSIFLRLTIILAGGRKHDVF